MCFYRVRFKHIQNAIFNLKYYTHARYNVLSGITLQILSYSIKILFVHLLVE